MNHDRYLAKFIAAGVSVFLALSFVWLIGLSLQVGSATKQSRWVYEVYEKKVRIANETPVPRILIVGGSSALFGIDTRELRAAWREPVVNMGVNAGLGLRYILWKARTFARPGDVLLLPLEYALYTDEDRPNAQVIDYAFARDPDYLRGAPVTLKLSYAAAMSPTRWVEGLMAVADEPIKFGDYGAHRVDDRGDQTHSGSADQTTAHRMQIAKSQIWRYGERLGRSSGGFPLLKEFAEWARRSQVCLVALPSSFMGQAEYSTTASEVAFYDTLASRVAGVGIRFLGNPYDFMYPSHWFFNTDYHLLNWARTRHTSALAALLGDDPRSTCSQPVH